MNQNELDAMIGEQNDIALRAALYDESVRKLIKHHKEVLIRIIQLERELTNEKRRNKELGDLLNEKDKLIMQMDLEHTEEMRKNQIRQNEQFIDVVQETMDLHTEKRSESAFEATLSACSTPVSEDTTQANRSLDESSPVLAPRLRCPPIRFGMTQHTASARPKQGNGDGKKLTFSSLPLKCKLHDSLKYTGGSCPHGYDLLSKLMSADDKLFDFKHFPSAATFKLRSEVSGKTKQTRTEGKPSANNRGDGCTFELLAQVSIHGSRRSQQETVDRGLKVVLCCKQLANLLAVKSEDKKSLPFL